MSLMYTHLPLDRCSNQRSNKQWLKKVFNDEDTRFCLINNGENLFTQDSALKALFIHRNILENVSINSCIFLGKEQNHAIFALDCNKLNPTDLASFTARGQWLDLRQATSSISSQDAAILSLAKALVYWHNTHLYCGKCASLNQLVEAGHARRCTNNQCHNMTFPRTDPAVIMLVESLFDDGIPRCLLGRQEIWPQGMYSTLAGFVDPGETLEQAVRREVLEESGIEVTDVSYIASQPWPFPASVMLGFTAVAKTQEIDISHDSLQDAQWFSRVQIKAFSERNATGDGYKMSSADSISHYLISAWLNQEIGRY